MAAPDFNLSVGCLLIKARTKAFPSMLTLQLSKAASGNDLFASLAYLMTDDRSWNGRLLVKMKKVVTPRAHKSTAG
jgi:hypothetical protein